MPTPTDLGDPPPTVLVSHHCPPTLIDDRFRSLIDAANAVSIETLPGLVDVRLQGWVAPGEAVVGQSDIDFTALISQPPGPFQKARTILSRARVISHSVGDRSTG
jgi:hypothetical protein